MLAEIARAGSRIKMDKHSFPPHARSRTDNTVIHLTNTCFKYVYVMTPLTWMITLHIIEKEETRHFKSCDQLFSRLAAVSFG